MVNSKKLLFSSECFAAFCARAGLGIPKTPHAANARIGYFHTPRMLFTFPSDSLTACNTSVMILLSHSRLRQIEYQRSASRAKSKNPLRKMGREPKPPNRRALQPLIGEHLPRVAPVYGAVHVPVLHQKSFAPLGRIEPNRIHGRGWNPFRHQLPMCAFVLRLQNATRSCSKN